MLQWGSFLSFVKKQLVKSGSPSSFCYIRTSRNKNNIGSPSRTCSSYKGIRSVC